MRTFRSTLKGARVFRLHLVEYERQRRASHTPDTFAIRRSWPILTDWNSEAGEASGHYFHQDLMVAREIFRRQPARHVDVGSSIYGFVSHVASYRDVDVIDIRPVTSGVHGINFIQADIMNLDTELCGVTDSISCLHALEHFGLGRYGDPINYEGWRYGLDSLTRMLTSGGILYLSVPTGHDQRVEFNAHRVFSVPFLRNALSSAYDFERLALVDDHGDLHDNLDPFSPAAEQSWGASYGCSIWVLRKR